MWIALLALVHAGSPEAPAAPPAPPAGASRAEEVNGFDEEGDEDAVPREADAPARRGRKATFATGRAVMVTGAVFYAAGWGTVALGSGYDVQKTGYGITRVGLPIALIGTFLSADSLDGEGLPSGDAAATLALPCWSAATIMTGPIDHGTTDVVHEFTWLGLEVVAVGLTVTQAVLNEVNLADRRSGGLASFQVDASVTPGGAQVGLSGTF